MQYKNFPDLFYFKNRVDIFQLIQIAFFKICLNNFENSNLVMKGSKLSGNIKKD